MAIITFGSGVSGACGSVGSVSFCGSGQSSKYSTATGCGGDNNRPINLGMGEPRVRRKPSFFQNAVRRNLNHMQNDSLQSFQNSSNALRNGWNTVVASSGH